MRIQFEFKMDHLPLAYRLSILSIIKEMIRNGSESYYEKLFVESKQELKPFAFATYIQDLQIAEDTIYGSKLFLTISSPSYEFIMYLMNGSKRESSYIYKDISLKLISKRLLPKPPELTETVTFKTLSPILIENKEQKPLLATDESFEKELNYYANLLSQELYGTELEQRIKVIQTNMKKVVIQENVHQMQAENIYFTGNSGFIQLQGARDDLQKIYDSGIGLRRSLGFGLLGIEEVGDRHG